MAYKPSMRRKSEELDMELDIRPVMNLMVVLIPLLLAGAQWIKLSVIEINVPPPQTVSQGGQGQNKADEQGEKEKRFGLFIAIAHNGFTVGNALAIISGEEEKSGPTVPKNEDGTYDFAGLKDKLIEVKEKIKNEDYADKNRVKLTASADIEYQTIISVMDNIQTYEDEAGNMQPLFPEVNFGKVR